MTCVAIFAFWRTRGTGHNFAAKRSRADILITSGDNTIICQAVQRVAIHVNRIRLFASRGGLALQFTAVFRVIKVNGPEGLSAQVFRPVLNDLIVVCQFPWVSVIIHDHRLFKSKELIRKLANFA